MNRSNKLNWFIEINDRLKPYYQEGFSYFTIYIYEEELK